MPRVYHRERAEGVHPRLEAFLLWWEAHGPFPLGVGDHGGIRADEAVQARLFAEGRSRAKTLAETPHGRGCALDCYPVDAGDGRPPRYCLDELDPRWERYGRLAELLGLEWGGRWKRVDRPHVEAKGWRVLAPPPGVTR